MNKVFSNDKKAKCSKLVSKANLFSIFFFLFFFRIIHSVGSHHRNSFLNLKLRIQNWILNLIWEAVIINIPFVAALLEKLL